MRTVEIFIDESGDIAETKPMVIAGVAFVGDTEKARDAFHARFNDSINAQGLSSGLDEKCDWRNAPASFLTKRVKRSPGQTASNDDFHEWHLKAAAAFELANAARLNDDGDAVTALAFSLRFDRPRPKWTAEDSVADRLLDRPYSERLKDVLELLLFHVTAVVDALKSADGCLLSLDLATREYVAQFPPPPHPKIAQLWRTWGIRAIAGTRPNLGHVIIASTLMPSDAVEILTGALNRRGALPSTVRVERARCCNLMSWDGWAEKTNKKMIVESKLLPKQIHYLADLLSNAAYNINELLYRAPVPDWFARGFHVDTRHNADKWIDACRNYAYGEKALAILSLRDVLKPGLPPTPTSTFFKRCTEEWATHLSADDLQALFNVMD